MLPIHGDPSTQILMPTCFTTSSPLSAARVGGHRRGGHLVGAQPDGQLAAQCVQHGAEHRVERHLRTRRQPGPVQPRALGEQHRRVARRIDGPAEQREHRGRSPRRCRRGRRSRRGRTSRPWVGGVAGQPACRAAAGVEVRLVAGVVDDHQRGVGRDAVEPGERRLGQADLQQRVPAVEVRPVGAADGDLAADGGDDVVGAGHRDGPDVDEPVGQHDRLHQRMPVRLDEPGHHAAVAEFDDVGVGPDPRRSRRPGRRPRRCARRPPRAPRRWVARRRRSARFRK